MFIQVIEGKTRDPDMLHRQMDAWEQDLKPGAIGYLGSTGGVTDKGDCILVARFESRDAAMRNSMRPEQTAWWSETEKCFDEPPRFHDSIEVQVMDHGGIDKARFVQVMEGHVTDRQRAVELERQAEPILAEARPDLLGAVTVFHDDDQFTELAYFRSEEEARAGEKAPMPAGAEDQFAEWQDVLNVERYLDLRDPWMVQA